MRPKKEPHEYLECIFEKYDMCKADINARKCASLVIESMLESIKFDKGELSLRILNQLLLPHTTEWVEIANTEQAYDAIKKMVVRGAPAIAMVGILAVALDAQKCPLRSEVEKNLEFVKTSRPTAVNLTRAIADLKQGIQDVPDGKALAVKTLQIAVEMLEKDLKDNLAIGKYGSDFISSLGNKPMSLLTICNTGSLATAGYGTALGIVRSCYQSGLLERLYFLETRPYNQGARLTAYEVLADAIPATLVTDSMAAVVMQHHPELKAVVVGADRVARNGDTANKIGTYQLAVLAKYHGVKFIVAAPTTSIDPSISSGSHIRIEERPSEELTSVQGVKVAPKGIEVWNPAFDVTPASLIDAIITEQGIHTRNSHGFDLF